MKNEIFFRQILAPFLLIVILPSLIFAQDGELKNRFETKYEAWKTIYEEDKLTPYAIANPPLYEIVEMGLPVLPFIVGKMEKNESGFDFQLELAFYLITRKAFDKGDWPANTRGGAAAAAAKYIDWWHNGIKDTPKAFNDDYKILKQYKSNNDTSKTKEVFQKIKNLGIAAIPLMIDKIRGGDIEFIKIISNHTNGSLNENALKDECLKWWDENKDKYTIIQYDQQQ